MTSRTPRVTVRPAGLDDVDRIASYNVSMAMESENKTIPFEQLRRGVARGMGLGEEVRYFMGEIDQRPAGTLMVTREWSDWRDAWVWWLQSVYVDPDYRGQGVFRAMLDHVTELAKSTPDVIGLRLYVEDDNDLAQATYQRTGFDDAGYRILKKAWSHEPIA